MTGKKPTMPPIGDADEAVMQRPIAADPAFSTSRACAEDGLLSAAIEAGARAFHDAARDNGALRWETASEKWRQEMRHFVRPVVAAALEAARQHGAV